MKVVFLNRYFHPDISATSQMLSDLAFHLADEFEVHVVTSRQKYDAPDARLPSSECVRRVHVHRVWTSRFGRAWLPGRALDYLTFYVSATLRLLRLARRDDVVVAMTDPPLVSIPAGLVARLRRARLVNWLQDVFPEAARELGVGLFAGPLGSAAAWLRDRSLRLAGVNVVLAEGMAATVEARGIDPGRIEVIHNWAHGEEILPLDPRQNPLRDAWGLAGKFVVGYSGNMGRAHDLLPVLDAAERLAGRTDICFLFIGDGKQRAALEAEVARRGIRNVVFQPYQAREALGRSLTVSDCHLVSLKPALEGLIVPSKLYSSLAAGRPVLFLGSAKGEVARLIGGRDPCGMRVAGDDGPGLAAAIEMLRDDPSRCTRMGAAGRRLFEAQFDRPIAMRQWSNLVRRLHPPSLSASGPLHL
jgi:glycosyltransferase involved in cell wall biosynthesis